jgi:hypothetical protein
VLYRTSSHCCSRNTNNPIPIRTIHSQNRNS